MLYCQLGVDKMSLKLDGWEDRLDDYTKSKLDSIHLHLGKVI